MKSNRRGGLGRGLGALIPTGPVATAAATPPAPGAPPVGYGPDAAPATEGPTAPLAEAGARGSTDATEDSTAAGTEAARSDGGLAPVPGARFAEVPVGSIVANPRQPRQVFDDEALDELKTSIEEVGFLQPIVVRELAPERYELVMGERRWRAAQALGREAIPAIIRETRDDAMLRDALLENIHRAD